MPTLLLSAGASTPTHQGEVFCCTYSPDGAFVLSAGWDGALRLWEATSGGHLAELSAGTKPLSACAFSPDGRRWLAGNMEGMLTVWDAHTHQLVSQGVRHTRPISAIRFSPDGKLLATASWDRNVCLTRLAKDRENRTLAGHGDIVGGCRFLPDGSGLLSWSHDQTLRLWDPVDGTSRATLLEHRDRVTCAAVAPDGRWAASGSRDGELVLWELETPSKVAALAASTELRGLYFLLDGQSLLVLDAEGRLTLMRLPECEVLFQLATGHSVQCGALSPCGERLALGCDDGVVRFVNIEGLEQQPLLVTATESSRRTATMLQRWFGRSTVVRVFETTCPACRRAVEVLNRLPSDPLPCPHCRRPLRYNSKTLQTEEVAC